MSTLNLAQKTNQPRQKCRKYPDCKDPKCKFVHPSKMCSKFPNCKYGQNCFDIHPICENDGTCKVPGCGYTHMKQKPVPFPRPPPEKQQKPQTSKKESTIDDIRSKVNEAKDLASKSDLVMQGILEQVLMKLSLLEKEMEGDKKDLAAQQVKNSQLQNQLNQSNHAKNKPKQGPNQGQNPGQNFGQHQQSQSQGPPQSQGNVFRDILSMPPPPPVPPRQAYTPANTPSSGTPDPLSSLPVMSPTFEQTPPVPHMPMEHTQMRRQLESQLAGPSVDMTKIQKEKDHVENQLQSVLHTNVELLEQNDMLKRRLEALEKKTY